MAKIDEALTTLARYKSFTGKTDTADDTAITTMIIAVSKYVEQRLKRKLVQAERTEVYDGRGRNKLVLKNYPIINGETFTLQQRTTGNNSNSWQTISSDLYFVKEDAGIVVYSADDWVSRDPIDKGRGGFVKGTQNWRVTYTAGYILPSNADFQNEDADDEYDLPYDLELAVWQIINSVFNRRANAGIRREQVRDISISFDRVVMESPEIATILNSYKRFGYR